MGASVAWVRAEIQVQRHDFHELDTGKWIEVFGASSNRCCVQKTIGNDMFALVQALVLTGIWTYGFAVGCGARYFAYLTIWSLTAQMVYVWLNCFTTYIATRMSAGKFETVERVPLYAWATLFMFDMLVPATFMVFVLFFTLVVNWRSPPTQAISYLQHGGNFALMMVDAFSSRKPYYLLHGVQLAFFGLTYVLFTYVYFLEGGTDCKGMHQIYSVLDWGGHFERAGIVAGVIFFVVTPVVNFVFWLLISAARRRTELHEQLL